MNFFDLTLASDPEGARTMIFSSLMPMSYAATSLAVTHTPFVMTRSKLSISAELQKGVDTVWTPICPSSSPDNRFKSGAIDAMTGCAPESASSYHCPHRPTADVARHETGSSRPIYTSHTNVQHSVMIIWSRKRQSFEILRQYATSSDRDIHAFTLFLYTK